MQRIEPLGSPPPVRGPRSGVRAIKRSNRITPRLCGPLRSVIGSSIYRGSPACAGTTYRGKAQRSGCPITPRLSGTTTSIRSVLYQLRITPRAVRDHTSSGFSTLLQGSPRPVRGPQTNLTGNSLLRITPAWRGPRMLLQLYIPQAGITPGRAGTTQITLNCSGSWDHPAVGDHTTGMNPCGQSSGSPRLWRDHPRLPLRK